MQPPPTRRAIGSAGVLFRTHVRRPHGGDNNETGSTIRKARYGAFSHDLAHTDGSRLDRSVDVVRPGNGSRYQRKYGQRAQATDGYTSANHHEITIVSGVPPRCAEPRCDLDPPPAGKVSDDDLVTPQPEPAPAGACREGMCRVERRCHGPAVMTESGEW